VSRERQLGRTVLRILIAALCLAAVVASIGLLRGDFSDTDWKVIATSLLLAVASALAVSGELARGRHPALGLITEVSTFAAFVLVTIAMWGEVDDDAFLRACGIVAIVAAEGAHMSFVRTRARPDDPASVQTLTSVAVLLGVLSGIGGILPLAGLLPEDGDLALYGEIVGVVLVGQLLCTALPPLVRRLRAGDERAAVAVPGERERMAAELRAVAERLADEPHLRRESETLRRLARTLE
jgi:hypothetical protein